MTIEKGPGKGPGAGTRSAAPAARDAAVLEGTLDGEGLRVALIVARFNEAVTVRLAAGAWECLAQHGARPTDCCEIRVPGAWEIPLAARSAAASGRFDAIVALGALVRGETSHYDVLATAVASGLAQVAHDTGVPIGFGVLTAESIEQALARAGGALGNRGTDAARSALEMAQLLRRVR